jgi:hypothetical protein
VTGTQGFIGDYVWLDLDGDGIQDADEPGLAGVTVELQDGVCSPGFDCPTATTDEFGFYGFYSLDAGDYTVVLVESSLPGTYLPTTATTDSVTLVSGQYYADADFGVWPAGSASIGDRVWYDADGDGVQDATEEGLSGITVELYHDVNNDGVIDAGDVLVGTAVTDANGNYLFDNLPPPLPAAKPTSMPISGMTLPMETWVRSATTCGTTPMPTAFRMRASCPSLVPSCSSTRTPTATASSTRSTSRWPWP